MLGCTDDDYFGDPDDVQTDRQDVEYLLESMSRSLPSIREFRVIRTMAGVRPLLFTYGKREDDVTRDFQVMDHEKDGARGLITVAGGKMVIFRLMAEKCVDMVCEKLGLERKCTTSTTPLPGVNAIGPKARRGRPNLHGLKELTKTRMVSRHGRAVDEILASGRSDPDGLSNLCICEPTTKCEMEWAIDKEMARTLDDIRRRTRISMGPCQGMVCAGLAVQVLAEKLGVAPLDALKQLREYLEHRFKGRRLAIDGDQLAQEELLQAVYRMTSDE